MDHGNPSNDVLNLVGLEMPNEVPLNILNALFLKVVHLSNQFLNPVLTEHPDTAVISRLKHICCIILRNRNELDLRSFPTDFLGGFDYILFNFL